MLEFQIILEVLSPFFLGEKTVHHNFSSVLLIVIFIWVSAMHMRAQFVTASIKSPRESRVEKSFRWILPFCYFCFLSFKYKAVLARYAGSKSCLRKFTQNPCACVARALTLKSPIFPDLAYGIGSYYLGSRAGSTLRKSFEPDIYGIPNKNLLYRKASINSTGMLVPACIAISH